MDSTTRHWRKSALTIVAVLCSATLLAACGGDTSDEDGSKPDGGVSETTVGERGGRVVYGLEAENANGWCLVESQLAISGIQVARAVYDTLTAPNENGVAVPLLAKDLTPNDDFTEWTIELRPGIKFHDGTDLDATVVKNNLDAYRGAYPARKSLLFGFVFSNIDTVEVIGDTTVKVTTKSPWSALPNALWGNGRVGIMAQSQLDDPDTCDSKLVGTGPFELVEWKKNEKLVVSRNDDYWQTDADGNQLPYLDEIEFRPMADSSARTNALLAGDLTMAHTVTPEQIDALNAAGDEGRITSTTSDKFTEVQFLQLNNAKAPFNNKNARLALASAIDRDTLNQTVNLGLPTVANGPFAPGNIGHLDDTGYPAYDLEQAKKYVAAYEADTGSKLTFTIVVTPDPTANASMAMIQSMAKEAGMDVKISVMEQAAQVATAVGGDFEAMSFRNFPGGDPDGDFVWWFGHKLDDPDTLNPVNFARFNDDEINRLLLEGRATDRSESAPIYEDINRRFASEVYDVWLHWALWNVSAQPEVKGLFGPDLPNGDKPSQALVTGHSVAALWIDD